MQSAQSLRHFILDNLRAGRWRVGDRLPPERSFSDRFGLSRGSVRKVLQDLRELGLIEQTVGSGTFVREGAEAVVQALPAEQVSQSSPAELMEARITLEPAILELVIANATATDFRRMDECCERAERAQSLMEFEHWDGMLHEAIALAAHNSFVAGVFSHMNQVRAQTEWGVLKRRSVTPERRLLYQREHRALVKAIKARDLDQARSAALQHLVGVRRNLFGG
ncbi:FadR family transcriptional regulator [Ramlibacter sp. AW1]|uniref:FadR family transcriptional regulator n=1 Tax=Ramlibacter aurantiacus TaxID=2801330 RepID=A0A936ZQ60_9BURK|nr:FCD domain-containing protein [Ramlibacter aurantiacus]MBL0421525.1 FadR family transcriptional regulator [Ramlibacter aurantiacus]